MTLRLWRISKLAEAFPLELRVLYRQFLLRVVDLEALSIEADIPRLLGQFAGVLILIGGVDAIGFLYDSGRPNLPRAALMGLTLHTEQSLLAGTMLIAGLIAVVTWDNIFPDRRDAMVLGPLPVRPRTILAAKLAAAGTLLAVGVLALNFGMGAILPLVTGPGWRFLLVFAAFWLTLAGAAVFVYGAVLTVQGFAAALLPRGWFLRFSAILQLAAFALFLAAWLFQPMAGSPGEMAAAQQRGILTRWPMFWFLGLFGRLSGLFPWLPEELARRAWLALAAVIAGAGISLALCYLRTMRKTVEEPDLMPRRGTRRGVRLRGDPLRTAVVQFAVRSLMRSRQHRVVYAFFLAVAFAIAVGTLSQVAAAGHAQPLTPGFLMGTLMMLCLAVFGLRSIFSLPVSLRANWILQVTQLRPAEQYIAAVRSAMLTMAAIPVWLTAAVLVLCRRPWHQGAEHLVVLGLAASIMTDASLIGVSKIPFACSWLPGKSNVQYLFWGWAAGFTPLAMSFSIYERGVLERPAAWAELVLALALIATGVWLLNRHRARTAVLYYEELEPEVITTLGIAAWQPREDAATPAGRAAS